ncbi:hypothetical protein SLE2022_157950 [Rubroshorea leprosula]
MKLIDHKIFNTIMQRRRRRRRRRRKEDTKGKRRKAYSKDKPVKYEPGANETKGEGHRGEEMPRLWPAIVAPDQRLHERQVSERSINRRAQNQCNNSHSSDRNYRRDLKHHMH